MWRVHLRKLRLRKLFTQLFSCRELKYSAFLLRPRRCWIIADVFAEPGFALNSRLLALDWKFKCASPCETLKHFFFFSKHPGNTALANKSHGCMGVHKTPSGTVCYQPEKKTSLILIWTRHSPLHSLLCFSPPCVWPRIVWSGFTLQHKNTAGGRREINIPYHTDGTFHKDWLKNVFVKAAGSGFRTACAHINHSISDNHALCYFLPGRAAELKGW